MANPRGDELNLAVGYIDGWGTHKDAALLETLAEEFPGQGDFLRERAEAIRLAIRLKKMDPNAHADADAARAAAETKRREKEAEEANKAGGNKRADGK